MADYGAKLTPQKRLGGKPGLKKGAVLPTVIIKEEDLLPLSRWQMERRVPIHVWHAFYDLAFGLALDEAQELIENGKIEPITQTFQAPGGATTKKTIYKFYYHYAYPLAETIEEPKLEAASIIDKNGHILPYGKFIGGTLKMLPEALSRLDSASSRYQQFLVRGYLKTCSHKDYQPLARPARRSGKRGSSGHPIGSPRRW